MKALLNKAAELLEYEAKCLKSSHTLDGVWQLDDATDRHAQQSHKALLKTAGELRQSIGVRWIPVAKELPDADTTVLIYNELWNEPVFMGWLDGDMWRSIHAAPLNGSAKEPEFAPPTHWAELPEGPSK
jgi:hypothetical protein